MHPLVVRTGRGAAFREHCQAGAELLHSHGSPERRQASSQSCFQRSLCRKSEVTIKRLIKMVLKSFNHISALL